MKKLLLLFPLLLASTPGQDDLRPSFLFAIADDWGYPHAGAYGPTQAADGRDLRV